MSGIVKLNDVVFCNSEHPRHKVQNLRTGAGKWTGSLKHEGELVCEFSLVSPTMITRLDIGNFWSASVEVSVGLSSWPPTQREIVLNHNFMNRLTSISGENCKQLLSFKEEQFQSAAEQYWDRIRITCKQPYRYQNDVFGLSMFALIGAAKSTPTKSKVSSSENKVEGEQLNLFKEKVYKMMDSAAVVSTNSTLNRSLGLGSGLTPRSRTSTPGSALGTPRSPNLLGSISKPTLTARSFSSSSFDRFGQISISMDKSSSSFTRESSGKENKEEPFVDKAKQFLKSCRFQDKGLEEVEQITFNQIKQIWIQKMKSELTKEERTVLKTVSRKYLENLVTKLETRKTQQFSLKRKSIADLTMSGPQKKRKASSSDREDIDETEKKTNDTKRNNRNALATLDVELGSSDDDTAKEKSKDLLKSRKKRTRTVTPKPEKRYKKKLLLSVPKESLVENGILVQEYNYKKNKELPLKGGMQLVVEKMVPVVFYKVGTDIHLVYKNEFYPPDVKDEHKEKLFRDYTSQQVHRDQLSLQAYLLLNTEQAAVSEFDLLKDDIEEMIDVDNLTEHPASSKQNSSKIEFNPDFGECPLCSQLFPFTELQDHASECDGILSAPPSPSTPSSATPLGTCPLCGDSMEPHLLPTHASSCGSEPTPRAFSKAGTLRPAFRECPVCDRLLPTAELAEHASGCQGLALNGGNGLHVNVMDSQSKCDFCEQLIPDFVMEEHIEECQARGVRSRVTPSSKRRRY
ncbi:uncharacterized protein LOC111707208 isoform X3 [Eurytemora carolleeae]|uniref:uncharacterized protein LOC111707208 isoform X3 n=1 Tax=Eurytemora carolleeae TaxID=1294199 RepID=UPI000C772EBF|nr:uncharacterized protein LOC111707208 isoform X3 [Eurytemora carolleeae]|eukprot:XP_023336035.1 uncharacterized protein LOC111707208 isoform X3 [Eurytemora affinis]